MNVVSESDCWTNGKPRFKYVCPGYRKKTYHFKAVDGVLLDEFIVQQLSNLSDEDSEHFKEILEIKVEEVLEQSNCEFVCRMRKGAPGSWKKRERPENGLKPGFLGRKRPGKSGKSADFTT